MAVFRLSSFIRRAFGFDDPTAGMAELGSNYANQCVTRETALTLSTVWACVRLISQSIASLPCGVFQMDEDGDKILYRDHALYRLLHDTPNADMTAFDFWQVAVATTLLWGNFYALKTYRGTGKDRVIVSLEILAVEGMSFRENADGSLTYIYSDTLGRKEFSEDQVFHLKGFGMSGRFGLSVIKYASNSFGNSLAIEEASGKLYASGMRASGVLVTPEFLKKDQRDELRQSILDQVAGAQNQGGTIVLEGGMTYTPLSIPPEDAQLLQSRSYSVEEICRWFSVPPILIGHNEKTTSWGTGIEQINLGFLQYTLTPIIKSTEAQIKRSLVSATERSKVFAEFNLDGFMRADSAGRAALYASGSQNGWMTREEIRKKENLPYIEGSGILTAQSNLVPLDMLGKVVTQTTPDAKS